VLGAGIVAVANIQYQRTRESEQMLERAQQAMSILRPELEFNLKTAKGFQSRIPEGKIDLPAFDTSAWAAVSHGDLLRGLSGDHLPRLMNTYRLINHANIVHDRILEMNLGTASALSGRDKLEEFLMMDLAKIAEQLQPELTALLSEIGTARQ
jgi:hypothetical protein